ncbi:MAG TPA: pilus assembly protein TadG-related protein, partial [Beijerinckiaceae bacterium]|nr:pilus assembly protein TadG-related protein [Beijerinckiaceae bacterium]
MGGGWITKNYFRGFAFPKTRANTFNRSPVKGLPCFGVGEMATLREGRERSSARLRIGRLARQFRREASGTVAVMFGVLLVPMMFVLGAALDFSRSSDDHATLQRAVDAAVIAAAREHVPDNERVVVAEQVFTGAIPPALLKSVKSKSFTMDAAHSRVVARVMAETSATLISFGGFHDVSIGVEAEGRIAKPQVRQLDLAMCIDASGSMQALLDAVKSNALNFEASLNAELKKRGIDPFDAMRVRVIYFRDYGGNNYFDPAAGGNVWQQNGWVYVTPTDPNRYTYLGDLPPLRASQFWNLPTDRSLFSSFVQTELSWGGGDEPESGLECVNEAMDSKWAKVGDLTSSGKKLTHVYPVVAVWTDANAHPPSHPLSLSNTS